MHETRIGRILTEEDLDAFAEEVAASDYDVETLRKRRREHSATDSGQAEVVPARIVKKAGQTDRT